MPYPVRLIVIVVLCIGMGAVTALSQQSDSDYALFERHGRMVRLPSGNHLSLYCAGTRKPTIVLESGFGGGTYATWHKIQPLLAKTARTCSYDRAGYGFSELGSDLPRDIKHDVLDLHALLHAAREQGPYILVGHSDGGRIIGAFADRFPTEIAGLIFLDAAVLLEKVNTNNTAVNPSLGLTSYQKQQLDQIRNCLGRAERSPGRLVPKPGDYCLDRNETSGLPVRMAQALAVISARPDNWKAFLSEAEQHYIVQDEEWAESLLPHRWSKIQIRVFTASVASLDDEHSAALYGIPISDHKAITEAREGRRHWESLQASICNLSVSCKSYLIPTSQHLVQNVVPDQVVSSIQEVIAEADSRKGLEQSHQ
jgi:pimeloyl-ACP methyl ester carboxylesterase